MRARMFTILHNFHWRNLRSQSLRPAPANLTDELAGRISCAGDQDDRLALGDFDRAVTGLAAPRFCGCPAAKILAPRCREERWLVPS